MGLPLESEEIYENVMNDILEIEGVNDCTELKMWKLRRNDMMVTGRVEIAKGKNERDIVAQIKKVMRKHSIKHNTIQIEDEAEDNQQ